MIDNRSLCLDPCLIIDNQMVHCHGLDLNLSGATPESPVSSAEEFSCKERNHKRLKTELPMVEESAGRNFGIEGKNLRGMHRLHFRDHIWAYSQRYHAAEAMDEAASTIMGGGGGERSEVRDEGNGEEMRLVQQLVACAEAVACRDRMHASNLLSDLKAKTLVFGTSFQRVASCFVQGLSDRLVFVQNLGAVRPVAESLRTAVQANERDEAIRLVYEVCPYIKFSHFVANAAILEAFEGESSVHVVDLGMTMGLSHGHQWCSLIDSLVKRPGYPPCQLKITGVGPWRDRLREIGDDLYDHARRLGLKFEFRMVGSNLEDLRAEDFSLDEGEAVVVNSILQLHRVVKESRGALNSVLQVVHRLSPKMVILVEQESSHNGPFFLGRFMEALHYYSAIFDSLDAALPRYDTRRAKIEQFYYAEEIKNIVSWEGQGRVERHERVNQWRRRMSRAGFTSVPIKMMAKAKEWLGTVKGGDGYTLKEEKGSLLLGWNSKPIIAASCWKC